jgi:lysophospholipase L1-like esterase
MTWPEPTRLVSQLAFAYFAALFGCQQAEASAEAPPAALSAAPASVEAPPQALPAAPLAPSATPPSPAPAPPSNSAAPRQRLSRVLVLGDSLSDEKVGGGGFVRILRQTCQGVSFENRAKGGFMVNQIKKRLEQEILPENQRYSHAIVFGGVNDLYSDQTANRTLPRIEGDLTQIYQALKSRGTQVIAITVTPWGGFKRWFTPERSEHTLALNRWILAQPASSAVWTALDAYPLLSCGDPERLCPELAAPHKDGLHFGKLGHEKLAKALLEGPFRACSAERAP